MDKPLRYIGFSIDEEVTQKIESARTPIIRGDLKIPLDPHLTLITPPMMERVDVAKAELELARVCKSTAGFDAILTGVDTFARRNLYIGVSAPGLHEFQRRLMQELGLREHVVRPVGATRFSPHITLVQATGPNHLQEEIIEHFRRAELPQRTTLKNLHIYEQVGPRKFRSIADFELN